MTREDAIDHLSVIAERMNDKGRMIYVGDVALEAVDMAIEALQERKTGKWFDLADEYDKRAQKHDYFCLECKTHADDFICGSEDWWCGKPPKYCPNCGEKMEVDE
jgi:hypothetical protein